MPISAAGDAFVAAIGNDTVGRVYTSTHLLSFARLGIRDCNLAGSNLKAALRDFALAADVKSNFGVKRKN